ncbi:heme ABC transporter ATP-binding protein [Avrilella dinanensis]|uniref:heme ABC transporter ATP-binding protein n=1 Tax=Avrilella dinanensis TaxID=2008672 RepID=UPI002409914D|nr:heme ABC transporter ATP-binding protein [Avrilella dinanensis]
MLKVHDISYRHKEISILQGISFDIKQGEFIAIIGPNGAGKSTLLSYISHEIKATKDRVFFKDKAIEKWSVREMPKHKSKFSQQQAADISLSVKEVVLMGRYPYFNGEPTENDLEIIGQWMKATDIWHLRERLYEHLSGGERQRVHLARVLAQLDNEIEQKILMMDEPLNNLDVAHQFRILELVKEQTRQKNTAIVVMHDVNLAAQFADRILLLKNGNLAAFDTVDEVLQEKIISDAYDFPCTITQNPINNQPLILFGINNKI